MGPGGVVVNLDIDRLLATGALSGPYRRTRPRVRRNRITEAARWVLAFLLTPNPWNQR